MKRDIIVIGDDYGFKYLKSYEEWIGDIIALTDFDGI